MKYQSFMPLAALLVACGGARQEEAAMPESSFVSPLATPETPATSAEATERVEVPIDARSGSRITGEAIFEEVPDANAVRITVRVQNAPPGLHGVHVHRIGDCSAPDASSAGPHFNPEGHEHALPPRDARHLGDLGNMLVRADGTGRLEIVVEGATLERDDPHSLLNRAIIFHAEQDTGEGESGEAGGRLACGEIGVDPNAPVASR